MINTTISTFGKVDVLHNNAANTNLNDAAKDISLLDFNVDIFHKNMDINVLGVVLARHYALPHMLEAGKGSIIFPSSSISLGGDLAQFRYGSSQGAMIRLVQAFAVNFDNQGIRCQGFRQALTTNTHFNRCAPH